MRIPPAGLYIRRKRATMVGMKKIFLPTEIDEEDPFSILPADSFKEKTKTWHSEHKRNQHVLDHVIEWVLVSVGSVVSIIVHAVWFYVWFEFKLDVSLLTNIVSLEAIMLSVLIMIDGRNKDKQNASQALHFQETMDRLEAKIDNLGDE